jgi:hypothetical protein
VFSCVSFRKRETVISVIVIHAALSMLNVLLALNFALTP